MVFSFAVQRTMKEDRHMARRKILKNVGFFGVTGEGRNKTEALANAKTRLAKLAESANRTPGVILLSGGTVFVVRTGYGAGWYDIHHIPGRGYASSCGLGSSSAPWLQELDEAGIAAFKACTHALQFAPDETVVGVSDILENIQAAAAMAGAVYELERERFEAARKAS